MSTALVPVTKDIAVSAETPEEMIPAQHQLIDWCKNKILEMQAEAKEVYETFLHAQKQKWKTSSLRRMANVAARRVQFYSKMLTALEHGYIVVPNFHVIVFAIRTKANGPRPDEETSSYTGHSGFVQIPQQLPAGEGEYKNPFPVVHQTSFQAKQPSGSEITKYRTYPVEWDEFEFPLNMAKPKIMEAATRAMALKLFDDLGVFPGPKSKADPVIIGRLIDPRNTLRFQPRCVSFMIAWHLDTRVL